MMGGPNPAPAPRTEEIMWTEIFSNDGFDTLPFKEYYYGDEIK
jgi:hypothetical protein